MSQPEQYKFHTHGESFTGTQSLAVTDPKSKATIHVNVRDGMWAIDVKDRDTLADLPKFAQLAIEKLGADTTQAIYTESVERFWEWARDAAQEHDFDTVHPAGRSGGWMAVDGTQDWRPVELIQPRDDFRERRDAFLEFAFEVVAGMDTFRNEYAQNLGPAAAVAGAFPARTEPIQVLAVLWDIDGVPQCQLYRNRPALEGSRGTAWSGVISAALAEPTRAHKFDGKYDGRDCTVRYLAVVE